MSTVAEDVPPRRSAVLHPWVAGGALLIASDLFDILLRPVAPITWGGGIGGSLLFSGALVVFALGYRGRGSLTGRRPLATAFLLALAVLTLVASAVFSISSPTVSISIVAIPKLVVTAVSVLLAFLSVIAISRARQLPGGWRFAPLWGLILTAVVSLIANSIGFLDLAEHPLVAGILSSIDGYTRLAVIAFLGVSAVILGVREAKLQIPAAPVPLVTSVTRPIEGR